MNKLLTKVLDTSINSVIVLKTLKNDNGEVVDFEYVLLNKSAEQVLGISKDSLIGKTITEHYPQCREAGILDFYTEVHVNKIHKKDKFCFHHNDGKSWCEISAIHLEDCIVASFINISDQEEKEKRIKESEELLKEVQDLSLLGYFEWNVIENKVYWSDQIYNMYGYEKGEFPLTIENSVSNIIQEDQGYINVLLKNARAGSFEYQDYQYRFIRKDGSIGTALGKAKTIKDENNKVIKLRGFIQDITERVKQESLLLECQDLSHTCSWDWDFKTNTITGTPNFHSIFKFPNHPLSYHKFLSFIVPYDRTVFVRKLEEAILGKSIADFPFIIDVGGESKTIWFKGKVVYGGTGKPLRMYATLMDITRYKKTEEELKSLSEGMEIKIRERTEDLERANEELIKINKELTKFSYTISHDLKAPLNTIEPLANFLKEKQIGRLDNESQQFLDLIIDRVHHMGDLIKNILESAKTKSKTKEICDSLEIVSTVLENFDIPSKIKVSIDPSLPKVHYNKTSLMQVFQNLLSNSIKFIDKPEGLIKVGYKQIDSSFYQFYVSDNGPGIKKDNFEKIFSEFETVHDKKNIESTGLGLSIVKKIINENNGNIWVESEEGKGCTLFFTIPITQ
jgi:PAS domain S-box-containing protein